MLYFQSLGITLTLLLLFGALIVVLSPVNDFSDRRIGVRRYFYQIKPLLFGRLQRFGFCQDAYLVAILINYPELRCPNGPIQTRVLIDGSNLLNFD